MVFQEGRQKNMNYARPTKQSTAKPTDIRVHREVTIIPFSLNVKMWLVNEN